MHLDLKENKKEAVSKASFSYSHFDKLSVTFSLLDCSHFVPKAFGSRKTDNNLVFVTASSLRLTRTFIPYPLQLLPQLLC